MTEPHPLAFDVPLDGIRLIEASAGTGKTFTLALLLARLVIERRLRVEQVLVVTFTRAATQELREKLREKLRLAARLSAPDGDALRERDDDTHLTARLIDAALARGDEDRAALHRRLRRAELDIDLAAVFTIDGFCLRVLGDEALAAGQALTPPELLGSERDLLDEVAVECWRWANQSPADAEALAALWKSPEALAKQLDALVRADVLSPAPPPEEAVADPRPAAHAALAQVAAMHSDDARAALEQAMADKALNARSYSAPIRARAWRQLERLLAADPAQPLGEKALADLPRLTPARFAEAMNRNKADALPASPLFTALADWLDAQVAWQASLARRQLRLVHALRDHARARLAHWKQVRRVQGFADLVAQLGAALAGPRGEALAARLRARYPVALVDEFQDTDPRQWAIFEHLYRDQPGLALLLVGDPKQAIYGFRGGDVHTYLQARAAAADTYALHHNFRSRPQVLAAIAALFETGGADAFAEPGIGFTPVQPGGLVGDDDFTLGAGVAPGLHLHALPDAAGKPLSADAARTLATRACVRRVHDLLAAGQRGEATVRDRRAKVRRAVQPGDIAILVARHQDGERIRTALAEAGIASVTAGRRSIFATDEARELLWLLEAVAAPGDGRRLRTALATVLLGEDAVAIAGLEADEPRHRAWLEAFQAWHERWERHGPLALVSDRAAAAAPRLLALADGERRLSNYLQLGEALQEASAAALGAAGLAHWLDRRISEADDSDDAQQLRLESDAALVQILTVHKSKGLEFPFVFLPYLAFPPGERRHGGLSLHANHDGATRVTRIDLGGQSDVDNERARLLASQQQHAEQLRLLYVALTRAVHGLWLAWGPTREATRTALAWLLHRPDGALPKTLDAVAVHNALEALVARAGGAIAFDEPPDTDATLPRLPAAARPVPLPAPTLARALNRDWWVYSFSQLSHESGGEEDGAEDEPRALLPAADPRFAGLRFGNALHRALELADFAQWHPGAAGLDAPGQRAAVLTALREHGYGERDLDDGVALLAQLVRATLTATLPEGTRLAELAPSDRCVEMEFHFAFHGVRIDDLLALLHRHGLLTGRHGFGARTRIEGLMTGKIDLVYRAGDKAYVLDYKSNQLPDYGPAALAAAMHESEYDLQYLLYTLALHRWLRFRRGAAYDYDRDFGGVRYVFCRGLDPRRNDGVGIYAAKPARALIEALDALLAPPVEAAA